MLEWGCGCYRAIAVDSLWETELFYAYYVERLDYDETFFEVQTFKRSKPKWCVGRGTYSGLTPQARRQAASRIDPRFVSVRGIEHSSALASTSGMLRLQYFACSLPCKILGQAYGGRGPRMA
jgi:hypothetical protein